MIIICDKPGQLGNRLYVFAHFIAFAKENNLKIANVAFDEYAPCFRNTKNDLFCRFPPGKTFFTHPVFGRIIYLFANLFARVLYRLNIQTCWVASVQLEFSGNQQADELSRLQLVEKMKDSKVILFRGWGFRDEPAFEKHADYLRDFFTPAYPYVLNVEKKINSARENAKALIGIHIRKGDYRQHEDGKYFFAPEQYVIKMKEAEKLFLPQKVKFLITSDERSNPKHFSELNFDFGTGHFLEDLLALSKCDYIIGPPSTYTMWASFYGKTPLFIMDEIRKPIQIRDFLVQRG